MGCRASVYFRCVLETAPTGCGVNLLPIVLLKGRCFPYNLTNPILGPLGNHSTGGMLTGLCEQTKAVKTLAVAI